MKVMGSATLFFEAIVISLAIPVAISIYDVPKTTALVLGFGLAILCVVAVGAMRRDRKTAVLAGSLVQLLVLLASFLVKPLLIPGIMFTLIWALAVRLSGKLPA
ncbi:MAG: hypothetical protein RIR66_940 [Actinomycetota bacterium]